MPAAAPNTLGRDSGQAQLTHRDKASIEQRSETRIERNIGIFVHVHSCQEYPDLVGKSIPCEAIDFSPHGVRCKSELLLPPGSLVNITIGIGYPFSMYLLLAEVRWEFEIDGELTMGLELVEGKRDDLKRWVDAFDTIFKEDLNPDSL